METTSRRTELVHVLPFALRPNQRLHDTLNELFIKPGSVEPRFLFKTMSSLAIDAAMQHQREVQNVLIDIKQDLDRSPFELELSNQITGRLLATGAFRLYFGITKKSQTILSQRLDEVANLLPDPRLAHEGPYKTMQLSTTLIPSQVPMTVNKIGEVKIDEAKIGTAGFLMKERLTEELNNYTYITVSDDILGRDEISEVSSYIRLQDKAS